MCVLQQSVGYNKKRCLLDVMSLNSKGFILFQGITNLRSIDYKIARDGCACQEVNYQQVAMATYTDYDTYQLESSMTGADLYLCQPVSRSDYKFSGQCALQQNAPGFTHSILIGKYMPLHVSQFSNLLCKLFLGCLEYII